jgi:signal transduction histidine kinase
MMLSSTLQGQIDVLSRIAGGFSTLARLPQEDMKPTSIRMVLEQVVGLMEKPVVGPTLVMSGDVSVVCDADQLSRLFQNLVLNAQQAIGTGEGKVTIEVKLDPLVVSVHDSGPGIPEEFIEKVFEPQFTTRGSGTGLGLSIVKAIADRHFITIECQSNPDFGTLFLLAWPA